MKIFAIIALFLVAFVALAQSAPTDVMNVPTDGVSEVIEMFGVADAGRTRQRICTAQLCSAVCRSLGFRWSRCNAQRLCVCRR